MLVNYAKAQGMSISVRKKKPEKVFLQEPIYSSCTTTLQPNWRPKSSAKLFHSISDTDDEPIYLAEGDSNAGALVVGQPSSYSPEYSNTIKDPSTTLLHGSSSGTEETGSSSSFLALYSQPAGHAPALEFRMEDKNTRNARPGWVGRPPNQGAARSVTPKKGFLSARYREYDTPFCLIRA